MGKLKNGEIAKAERKLKFTRYLQFQLSESHKQIDEIEDEISLLKEASCYGRKLHDLEHRLEYWKGKRDTFQEIWNYKNEEGI